ncbi:MAG TPA: MlaD family protein [Gemmatimonadaceae bacterium]|nr:MlaD family protein [Gemmatimonadaceae bacterium]
MSRNVEWSQLKTGVVGLAVLIALAVSILLFARVGALHGDTTEIYVVTDDANGVLNGTEVWLAGQKIGLVKDIHFRPITTDTLERLAIHLQILSDQMHFIRRDAWADIRPGGNLIGSPVVWISAGTSNARALHQGDTLKEISTGKMRPVSDRVTALVGRLNSLADSGGRVVSLLNSQIGTLGKVIGTGVPRVAKATGQMSSLLGKATTGEGSVALMLNGGLGVQLAKVRAAKDSITYLLSSGNGNIGRFRRDSTLMKQVAHLQSELDSLRGVVGNTNGITRARTDTALTAEMARMRVELAALMADLKKHPLRYLKP